jgi:hypothetical protein
LFLLENTSLYDLPFFIVCEQPTVDFWWECLCHLMP